MGKSAQDVTDRYSHASSDCGSAAMSAQSSDAEVREALQEGERVQEEMERRSATGKSDRRQPTLGRSISGGERRSTEDADKGSETGARSDTGSHRSSGISRGNIYRSLSLRGAEKKPGSATGILAAGLGHLPEDKPLIDKVELALIEAKRAALAQEGMDCAGSGSGSNVGSGISGTGSGLGSRSGTSFGNGSSIAAALLPTSVVETLPEDMRQIVENTVAKVVVKTGQELADMQIAMEKSKAISQEKGNEMAELEAKVAKLRVKANINENLTEALSKTRDQAVKVADERDDLQDKLVGMEARLNAKIERHEREVNELKQEKKQAEEEMRMRLAAEQKVMTEELTVATKEIEKAKKQKFQTAAERDVIRRSELITSKAYEAEVSVLQSELNAATRELERKEMELGMKNKTPWDEFEEQRQLEEKLKEQRDHNVKMTSDMHELRMEMMNIAKQKEDELAALRAKVEVVGTMNKPQVAMRRRKAAPMQKGAGGNRLSCIEEDDNDDIASAAGSGISGQVSSSADGVGDLSDFDDKDTSPFELDEGDDAHLNNEAVKRLYQELEEYDSSLKHLKDEKAAKEAELAAKISRMSQQLQHARDEAAANRDEVERLKQVTDEIDAEKQEEIILVKHKLNQLQDDLENSDTPRIRELEDQVRIYAVQLDETQQQLAFALESKRLLNVRLEDTKRELDAMEVRHARVVEELRARLSIATGGDPRAAEQAENGVLQRLRIAEEERNIFRNELECQKVHWQSQLESEQQQLAMALSKLKEEQDMSKKDQELKRQVEASLQEKQRLLNQARQAQKDAEERADRESAAARAVRNAAAASGANWLALLRCPMRANPAEQVVQAVNGAHAAGAGGNGQIMVWQTISSMSGATALLCNAQNLNIMDASKKAFSMWGSSALRGSSLASLVFDETTASWLQSELTCSAPAFVTPGTSVQGFWLRELGCVEFRSKLGSAFDSSVTCARLPDEPPNRPAVVVVIVEPLQEEQQMPRAGGGVRNQPVQNFSTQNRPVYRRGAPSIASSVHSEDITANDSVSNVNVRY